MKKIYCLFAMLFFISTFSAVYAQFTTEGEDFWVTFDRVNGFNQSLYNMQIRVVGSPATTGTIWFTQLQYPVDFIIGESQIYTYSLSSTERTAASVTTTGVSSNSIRITTNSPVSVYAYCRFPWFADATNVLPVTAFDTEYRFLSYKSGGYIGGYAIIATEDNTLVFENGAPISGALSIGQVYFKSANNFDMTGYKITANHPIALFNLVTTTSIPEGVASGSSLRQQLAPIRTWGTHFFVPVSHLTKDIVRIVVSQDNTNITQIGGVLLTPQGGQTTLEGLLAGQFVELQVSLSNNGCYIIADKPVGVCSYLTGVDYNPLIIDNESAPSQCWVPAINQVAKELLIAPFIPIAGGQNIDKHYALIVAPSHTKNETTVSIGGDPPFNLSSSWIDHPEANMSFYNMPLDNSSTSYFYNNPKGLIVFCYGIGNYESYYYLAGSAMRDLDAAFYANDVHFQELKDTAFCANEVVNFRAEIENMGVDMDSIKWYISGTEHVPARDSLEWSKTFTAGEYEIKMWVRFENDSTISKTGILKIENCNLSAEFYANNVHHASLQDTTFCNKNVHFQAEIEGLHPEQGSIKWLINGEPQPELTDLPTWNREFETGTHTIDMEVRYESGETVTISGNLRMEIFWIKIRNIRTH